MYEQHPNDSDTDYRSEIIAASLINRGYDPEQIQIIRKGTARRGFSKEDALEEIRMHREEEFFARKFFQLFENMADEILVNASLYEAHFDRKISYPDFARLFEPYWPVLKISVS